MFNLFEHNDEIKKLLNHYNTNNLHNSIIFYGPKGIGKRTFINNFIYNILKNKFVDNSLSHHSNLLINNTHPNIKVVEKEIDKKSKKLKTNITIEQIRNIKKFINSSSSISNLHKFIIIDSADDLNINSSNSLLKSLEEPNVKTFLFLISHQISNLLPTLRSRCLKIKLNKLSYSNFKNTIENSLDNVSEDDIKFFYDLTLGSPGTAITLLNDNILNLFELTINNLNNEPINKNKLKLCEILSKFDNEKFKNYLSILKSILVILNKIKSNSYNADNYISDKFKILKKVANSIPTQFIVDRFDFLSRNEKELFTYNLDKKIFMLKFLVN